MIGPLYFNAYSTTRASSVGATLPSVVGTYDITDVAPNTLSTLRLQTRLIAGTGVTWTLRAYIPGSSVTPATAPQVAFQNAATKAAIAAGGAITATSAPQLHGVIADGVTIVLEILSVTGNGVLQLEAAAIEGGFNG